MLRFIKKRLFIVVCLMAVASAHDVHAIGASVSGGYEYVPYAKLKNAPAVLEQAEIDQTKIYGEAVFPFIVLKEGKRIFVNSLYADRFSLSGRNFGALESNTDNLIGVDYSFTWLEMFDHGWKSIVSLKPGLYYDGYDASRNIYRLQGTASFWKTLNAHLEAGLGGGYVDDFGVPKPVPIFGLKMNWSPTGERPKPGSHILNLVLPVSASYAYVLTEKVQVGAAMQVTGGKYRLTQGSSTSGDSVEFSVQTLGPTVHVAPSERWSLDFSGGLASKRLFKIRDSEDHLVSDFSLENASFGSVEAKYNF